MKLDDINPSMQRIHLFRFSGPGSNWREPKCSYQYRLFYVVEGKFIIHCGDEDYTCDTDSLIFWAPGTWYSLVNCGLAEISVITVFFDFDKTRTGMNILASPRLPAEYDEEFTGDTVTFDDGCVFSRQFQLRSAVALRPLFTKLLSTQLQRGEHWQLSADSQLTLLLLEIQQVFDSGITEPTDSATEQLLSYLRLAAGRHATCEQLAAELNYNQSWLNRIVKRHTGLSMRDYVFMNKIRMAEDLLRFTSKPVTDIALDLGFTDSSHLIKVFREFNGTTPFKFRRSFRS